MNNWLPSLLTSKLQKLRHRLLNDPYYRLQSVEEISVAAALGIQIDVNQATVDDWLRLPGLSIHQARNLVELSRSGVYFYCLEDIAAALSLPVGRLEVLQPLLRFYYYDEEDDIKLQVVNVNTATVQTLAQVSVMDRNLAQAVVENRRVYGQYRNLADFQRRLSLSGDVVGKLMYYLRF